MHSLTVPARLRRFVVAAALAGAGLSAPAFAQQCPPEARIQALDQTVDEGVTVSPNGQSSKPNNATYLWEVVSGPGPITWNPSATVAHPSFVAPQVTGDQQLEIRLTVTGCSPVRSHSTTGTVTIRDTTLPPQNTAPTADAAADPPIADEHVLVTLDGTGSTDPESDPLSFEWTQAGGPTVAITNANSSQATFTTPSVPTPAGATLEFKLRVTDPGGLFDETSVVVNVVFANDSPFASLQCPLTVDEGDSVTLDGSPSSDYEDDLADTPLAYAWSQLEGPPNIPVASETGDQVTFTAPVLGTGDVGLVKFQLTVTDSGDLYSTAECEIFIEDVTAPVFGNNADRIEEATGPGGANVEYGLTAIDNVEGDVSGDIVCVPPSGSLFTLDVPTQVDCAVEDANENEATTRFLVTVKDRTKPVIDEHEDIALEAIGPLGNVVTYDAPQTDDDVDVDLVATCSPPSGATFALGSTDVLCDATDFSGNAALRTKFVVTIHDTTPPAIEPHDNLVVEATKPQGADVAYASPAWHDAVSGDGTANCLPASGSTFALGTHTVHCRAQDAAGNQATSSFAITVRDTTPPAIDQVDDILGVEATGPNGAPVSYTNPAWHDAVSGDGTANCLPASGSTFALGTHTVHCRAQDAAGNQATSSFAVQVVDTTAPTLSLPSDITEEATDASGAVVSFSATANDVVSGSVPVTCAPASGSTFDLAPAPTKAKTTLVACSATDGAGNTASGNFNVTVQDTTAPDISPHAAVNAIAASDSGAHVTYTDPTSSDTVDGSRPVTCTPASGAWFTVGTNTVTCKASDTRGNEATSTFNVVVSYDFSGFFRPVDNLPTTNIVKAGQGIPVKFSLGGNQGLSIFETGYPKSVAMNCQFTTSDTIEETVTAGGSALQYDATAGQYIYVWKTEKSWAGTCRQLQVKYKDGTTQVANFNFTR